MAADNVVANPGSGGATFRTFSDGANEWPANVCVYVTGGSAGAWTLQQVDAAHGLPVNVLNTTLAVTQSGTWTVQQGALWSVSGTVTANAGTGPFPVGGDVASGSSDSGNPIKLGGVATNTTPSVVASGQRQNAWFGIAGQLIIGTSTTTIVDGANCFSWLSAADSNGFAAVSMGAFNGSLHDRWRSNTDLSLLGSAARTANTNSADQTNYNGRGVKVVINITAAGTTGLVFTIKGKDSISGNYYTLLASANLTTTGTTVLTVYPGVGATANVSASDVVPRTWRVEVTGSDGSSFTYSVSGVTIL